MTQIIRLKNSADEVIYLRDFNFYEGTDGKDYVEGTQIYKNGVPIPAFQDSGGTMGFTGLLELFTVSLYYLGK